MLTLFIVHNVFLKDEEFDNLIENKKIQTQGVSLPVWYFKGNTSEPAEEVFCNYTISFNNELESIRKKEDGYEINISELTLKNNNFSLSDYDDKNLFFSQQIKTKFKDKNLTVIHYVNIKTLKSLLESLD